MFSRGEVLPCPPSCEDGRGEGSEGGEAGHSMAVQALGGDGRGVVVSHLHQTGHQQACQRGPPGY